MNVLVWISWSDKKQKFTDKRNKKEKKITQKKLLGLIFFTLIVDPFEVCGKNL